MKKFVLLFVVLLAVAGVFSEEAKKVEEKKDEKKVEAVVVEKKAEEENKKIVEEKKEEKKVEENKKDEEKAKVVEEVKKDVQDSKKEVKEKEKVKEVKAVTPEKKLDVSVYFESLCPDSFDFIKNQLYPSYKSLASYINLNLIPFGKSHSIENGTKFDCHHGPAECKGNKILTCAYERLPNKESQVDFTKCFMETFKVERDNEKEFGQKCAKEVGLDHSGILSCYNSEEGLQHQLRAEKETAKVGPKSVPTIVYDEKFDQALQDSSVKKFKEVVCNLVKKTQPSACEAV